MPYPLDRTCGYGQHRRCERYPYLVFYVERSDHVDVWRVLQGQRDIPAWMQDPEDI